ncbi:hypothetical protein BD770DRAFT_388539 [Pilaira anomala]|nr:hypothetical protein BD770DRAFT_388539 [Pilaira anomala]
MSLSFHHEAFLSYNKLDTNDINSMWTAFSKCKSYIHHGQRLEYMSWRLWYCRQHQQHDRIDNNIKQIITSLLLSPAFMVHDAYSHEVPQLAQTHSEPITTHQQHQHQQQQQQQPQPQQPQQPTLEPIHARSFIQQNTPSLTHTDQIDLNEEEEEEDEEDDDDDDYYLSDDIYEEEDEQDDLEDTNYHFIKDFTKTQPRPATPRRSLLSDLLQRVSSPPSLLSNSSSSFTSHSTTQHSILLDDDDEVEEDEDDFNSTLKHHTTNNTTLLTTNHELKWRESFHGW